MYIITTFKAERNKIHNLVSRLIMIFLANPQEDFQYFNVDTIFYEPKLTDRYRSRSSNNWNHPLTNLLCLKNDFNSNFVFLQFSTMFQLTLFTVT